MGNQKKSREERLRNVRARSAGRATIQHPMNEREKQTAYVTNYSKNRMPITRHRGLHRLPSLRMVLGAAVVVLVIAGAIASNAISGEVRKAGSKAKQVMASYASFEDAVDAGDVAAANKASAAMIADADKLKSLTQGSLWRFVSILPVAGHDAHTAQELASAAQLLSHDIVEPFMKVAQKENNVQILSSGKVNLALLSGTLDTLNDNQAKISNTKKQLSALDATGDSDFAKATQHAQKAFNELALRSQLAHKLAPHAATILGSQETRNYLVVVQDNDRLRSLGGAPLSRSILTASNGSLVLQPFSHDDSFSAPLGGDKLLKTSAAEDELVGDTLSSQPSQITSIPKPSRAAELLAQAYENQTGNHIDGVILLDPYVVQNLLAITGDVTLDDEITLDSKNFAEYVLKELAQNTGSWEQGKKIDDVCNASIGPLFEKLGDIDTAKLTKTLHASVKQGRLSLWLADTEEEKLISDLGFAGIDDNDKKSPVLGVYINEKTNGRINWYLHAQTEIDEASKESDGSVSYQVTTTLTNTLDMSTLYELWSSAGGFVVLGNASAGRRSDADMMLQLYLLASEGISISDVDAKSESQTANGLSFSHEPMEWDGRKLENCAVQLDYGETVTITYKLICPADAGKPTLRQTPCAHADKN
ncbi:DUF4012 domain-containing protein [uncultured Olegusella sp.]|uniref:DUF4012 domain-containing protein n=1 Tax=uncultured Olegusella sp. TaxID=1979846 RepID=UPI002633DA38|nr:DUF4012 domain-containing protein [uncultured Olegusella sp.]